MARAVRVETIASRLRKGEQDFELKATPSGAGGRCLMSWGVFNPFGLTASRIDAVPVPSTGEILLVHAADHPMFPDIRAIGLVPPRDDQDQAVYEALTEVFARNGRERKWYLLRSLPTYVHLVPDSPIEVGQAATLLRLAIRDVSDVWYRGAIEDLLESWQDPWAQATEAIDRVLNRPEVRQAGERIRGTGAGPTDPEAFGALVQAAWNDGNTVDDEALFDVWFALVTQPEYVSRIEQAMEVAWFGARSFAGGEYD